MEIKLFEKNSCAVNSPIYISYIILKSLKKKPDGSKVSIFKILRLVKEINPSCNAKQFFYALIFLHLTGVINFTEPYIEIKYA